MIENNIEQQIYSVGFGKDKDEVLEKYFYKFMKKISKNLKIYEKNFMNILTKVYANGKI